MTLLHKELGVTKEDAALVAYEVTKIMGESASHGERIKYLERKFKDRALLLAVFILGWESAIADAFKNGINESGAFDPFLSGNYVADLFIKGNDRYNEILRHGDDVIAQLIRAIEYLEELERDRGVI